MTCLRSVALPLHRVMVTGCEGKTLVLLQYSCLQNREHTESVFSDHFTVAGFPGVSLCGHSPNEMAWDVVQNCRRQTPVARIALVKYMAAVCDICTMLMSRYDGENADITVQQLDNRNDADAMN